MMHCPPAVSFPVGRSRLAGGLLGTVLAAGALTLLAWCSTTQTIGTAHISAWLVWLVASALSMRHWALDPAACLTWKSPDWTWCASGGLPVLVQGVPQPVLDLPATLLLRLRSARGGIFYVWADRHTAPDLWLPLRRAVFGSRKP